MDVHIFLVDVLMFLVFDREQGRMHVHIQREVTAQQHAGLLQVVVPALRRGWRRNADLRDSDIDRLGPKVNCNVQSEYESQALNVKLCKGLLPAFSTGPGPVLPFAPKSTVV